MSGIEVAGLLLGAIPILVEAVGCYKEGIQKSKLFFRKRAYVEKLALSLLLQQRTLAETLKSILTRSGCLEVWRLEADPTGYFNGTEIQAQVLNYLGHENDIALKGVLQQSNDTIRRVAGSLAGLVRATQGTTDSLIHIINANQAVKERQLDLIPRVKLMFNGSELKKAIQDLDSITNSLCHFATIVSSNREVVEQNSSKHAISTGKGLRKVRKLVIDLHKAIFKAWRNGCHNHEAKMLLEDRLDTAVALSKNMSNKGTSTVLVFQMIFVASKDRQCVTWQEAPIQVPHELLEQEEDSSEHAQELQVSSANGVSFIVPVTKPAKSTLPLVTDICLLMESIRGSKEKVGLCLVAKQAMGKLSDTEKVVMPCCHLDKVLLRDLLAPNTAIRFPIRSGMILALQLASNLLQLSCTEWLRTTWSKDTIYFLSQAGIGGSACVDFNRPYILLSFDREPSSVSSSQPRVDLKEALLDLGILLLEIWHSQTLESHFNRQDPPGEYYERLTLGSKWLDEMNDPLPDLYEKAVAHCIRGMMGGETRLPGWEDIKFLSGFCQDVIEPLYKNCKQWR